MKTLLLLLIATSLHAVEWTKSETETLHYYERFRLSSTEVKCWIFVFSADQGVADRAFRQFPGLLATATLADYGIYESVEWELAEDGSRAGVKRKRRSVFVPYEETIKGRRDVNRHQFELLTETCDDDPDDGCTTYLTEPDFTATGVMAALEWADEAKMAEFETLKAAHLAELAAARTARQGHTQLPAR